MTPETPDDKSPEVRFRHADDEKWQDVRALEIDGRRAVVREKWLDFTPGFLSLYAKWDPGMMIHEHGHNSDHVVFVIEGEMTCGDVRCTAGMHITLEHGASFGPFGMWTVFEDNSSARHAVMRTCQVDVLHPVQQHRGTARGPGYTPTRN